MQGEGLLDAPNRLSAQARVVPGCGRPVDLTADPDEEKTGREIEEGHADDAGREEDEHGLIHARGSLDLPASTFLVDADDDDFGSCCCHMVFSQFLCS
jgi:hypothetical protein